MIPFGEQQFDLEDGPQFNSYDVVSASFEMANMDTFSTDMARNSALDEFEKSTSKKLTIEELNSSYKDVEVPFSEPTNELVAFHLNEEGKRRRELNQVIANGPGGSFYNGALSFGSGIVAHAMDPVEFGVSAAFGLGLGMFGSVASKGVFGQRAIKAGQLASKISKGGIGYEAAEGVIGNAALEPYIYASSKRAQVDYGVEDAFISIVGGGLAFPAAKFGIKKSWNGLQNLSDSSFGLALKNSIGQFQEGFRPQLDYVKTAFDKYVYGETPKDVPAGQVRGSYIFEPIESVKDRPFYIAGKQASSIEGGSKVIGDYFGEGFYMTDNPNFANNLATHPMDEQIGDVFEVKLNDSNVLDIDAPNRELLDSIELPQNIKEVIQDANTIKQAMDQIRSRIDTSDLDDTAGMEFINGIKARGYDGLRAVDNTNGHNTLHVFPESASKINEEARYKPDAKSIPKLDKTEAQIAQSKVRDNSNKVEHDNIAQKQWDEFTIPPELADLDIEKLKSDLITDLSTTIKGMQEEGVLSKESFDQFQEIQAETNKRESLLSVANDFANCLLLGGSV